MRSIDGHEVLGMLGQGGMGRVLKVRVAADGSVAALKLLAPHIHLTELLGMAEIRRRFRFEAEVLGRIDHPHVVQLLGQRLEGRQWYVLLEYHCRTVSEWIGEGPEVEELTRPIRPDLALTVARQATLALQVLHSHGLVHRDVKPANLLLDTRRGIKLADFGLSKLRGEREFRPPQLLVGSPFYAPPEQAREPELVDQRADWYSLGVVLFRLLTGRLPGRDADWTPVEKEFGQSGTEFLRQILAERPGDRPAHAAEILVGLNHLERYWREQRASMCRLRWQGHFQARRETVGGGALRREPRKVAGKDGRRVFPVNELWQSERHHPTALVARESTVHDQSTGLVWQRSGSSSPMEWTAAQAYLARLNRHHWAGRSGWRLPTVDELLSLLEPGAPLDDFCLQPLFDARQSRLWSADRRSFIAAWLVDVESGYLGWQDFTCPAFVRAVSSAV
jgi:eukaryotic-like serine/threonine-protein kinase